MNLLSLFAVFIFIQTEIPFKPANEFQVNIDMKFLSKPTGYGASTFTYDGQPKEKGSSTTIPFLIVKVSKIKFQNDEVRILAINSLGKRLSKRKISPALELRFEMGFVEDLRNKTSPNEVTIYFLTKEKKELRKIVLTVSSEGVFKVNGQWHGQF